MRSALVVSQMYQHVWNNITSYYLLSNDEGNAFSCKDLLPPYYSKRVPCTCFLAHYVKVVNPPSAPECTSVDYVVTSWHLQNFFAVFIKGFPILVIHGISWVMGRIPPTKRSGGSPSCQAAAPIAHVYMPGMSQMGEHVSIFQLCPRICLLTLHMQM